MSINRRSLFAVTAGAFGPLALTGRTAAWAASPPPGRQTYFLLVFTDPIPGQEAAYARWFSEGRLHDMTAVPGVVAAEHYRDAGLQLRSSPMRTPHDLIFYTIVTDQPYRVRDAISRRAAAGAAWPKPTIASVWTATYRAFRPQMKGVAGEPANASGGEAATYLVVAFGDAVGGQDRAFNTWYDTVHEPELMSNPGVVSGQRAVLSELQMGPSRTRSQFLMLMTLVTSDLPAVYREILAGGPPSPALDRTRGYGYTYRAVGP